MPAGLRGADGSRLKAQVQPCSLLLPKRRQCSLQESSEPHLCCHPLQLCENGKPKSQPSLEPAQYPGQGHCQRPPWTWLPDPPSGRGSPAHTPLPDGKREAECGQQTVSGCSSSGPLLPQRGPGTAKEESQGRRKWDPLPRDKKAVGYIYQEA